MLLWRVNPSPSYLPLTLAASYNHEETVQVLLEDDRVPISLRAFEVAAEKNLGPILGMLIDSYYEREDHLDADGDGDEDVRRPSEQALVDLAMRYNKSPLFNLYNQKLLQRMRIEK